MVEVFGSGDQNSYMPFCRMAEERLNKAYPCQYCGMSFAQNWLLKRHWKTHTGEKNFKCTICSRSFSLRDSCVRHLRTVHKELVRLIVHVFLISHHVTIGR